MKHADLAEQAELGRASTRREVVDVQRREAEARAGDRPAISPLARVLMQGDRVRADGGVARQRHFGIILHAEVEREIVSNKFGCSKGTLGRLRACVPA